MSEVETETVCLIHSCAGNGCGRPVGCSNRQQVWVHEDGTHACGAGLGVLEEPERTVEIAVPERVLAAERQAPLASDEYRCQCGRAHRIGDYPYAGCRSYLAQRPTPDAGEALDNAGPRVLGEGEMADQQVANNGLAER